MTASAVLVGVWFWRGPGVRLAFFGGIGLAAVACFVGVLVDILTSAS